MTRQTAWIVRVADPLTVALGIGGEVVTRPAISTRGAPPINVASAASCAGRL
jgi:hypothetical protein